ncbi:uncharacterized protein LOC117118459 [Anneissia japonica]|uniref:uncharacterized protein LOC117118459 n=1 Tax=Anneissia japonica TaxID=1529436 RepID=UPI0014255FBD|nr:uncharacterized protein LOC117118459 [Anneissia japonica]
MADQQPGIAVQQPAMAVQQPPTQPSIAFTTHPPFKKGGVLITAIFHIVLGGLCVAMGIWAGVKTLEYSLLYFSVLLYIPAGIVGLRAASKQNKCTVMIYQTMSIFCFFAAASQSLYLLIFCIKLSKLHKDIWNGYYIISIAQPILALLFNVGEVVVAAIAIFIARSSSGWCCDTLPTQSNLAMKSSLNNPVSSMSPPQQVFTQPQQAFAPPQQAFTVQQGMNISQPNGQPEPNGMSVISY